MSVVITGANRGIGRGLYDLYAARGPVLGTHRAPATDGFMQLDVTDPDSHAAFAKGFGDAPVDLLICNAGVFLDRDQSVRDTYSADQWAGSFAANVAGVFWTVQSLLPNLQKARGKVAIISSQMGSHARASGRSYAYRASKAAAVSVGRNLALDLAEDGVAVGIYHPGWVQTDMGTDAAAITVAQSVQGLAQRFDALSLATSGCFEAYDGSPMPD